MLTKGYFSTKRLVTIAILASLGSALMLWEIPFLLPFKIDPSDSTVVVGAILYGPVAAIIIAFIKGFAHFLLLTPGDFGVGELVAFTASLVYTLPLYYSMRLVKRLTHKKPISPILIRIIPSIVGTISLTVILPLLNFLFFVQLYALATTNSFGSYNYVLGFALGTIPGNVVKGAVISTIFILLSLKLQYVAEKLDICDNETKIFD